MAKEARLRGCPRPDGFRLRGERRHEGDLKLFSVATGGLQADLDPLHLKPHHFRLRRAHDDGAVSHAPRQLTHPRLTHREVDRHASVHVRAKETDCLLDLGHLLGLQPDAIKGGVARAEAEDGAAVRELRDGRDRIGGHSRMTGDRVGHPGSESDTPRVQRGDCQTRVDVLHREL